MKIFFNFYKKSNIKISALNKKKKKIIFNNNLYQDNLVKNYDLNYFKGLNVFLIDGKKMILIRYFNLYFNFFFNFITNKVKNNNYTILNYSYLNEIKSVINDNYYLNNPINLLNWYLNYFNFMFNVKNSIKNKKKKNKIDLNLNNLKIIYIIKKKRNILFFKWLKKLFYLNYSLNFKKTLYILFNDVFLNFKNSNLYKYKISIYKNLILN